jgi:PTH1 family peptidyl-tRNA hydrolase
MWKANKLAPADDYQPMRSAVIKIVCGLGNIGAEYDRTRHNIGFDVIDDLVGRWALSQCHNADRFRFYRTHVNDDMIYLMQPLTYVNRSGVAVIEALRRFDAEPTELFVICDDFNLPLGSLRIRAYGSSGGHNGLHSIIEELDRNDFPRLRLGIGPLPDWAEADHDRLPEFVLGRFNPEEKTVVTDMLSLAVEATEVALKESLDLAISVYNKTNPTPGS